MTVRYLVTVRTLSKALTNLGGVAYHTPGCEPAEPARLVATLNTGQLEHVAFMYLNASKHRIDTVNYTIYRSNKKHTPV